MSVHIHNIPKTYPYGDSHRYNLNYTEEELRDIINEYLEENYGDRCIHIITISHMDNDNKDYITIWFQNMGPKDQPEKNCEEDDQKETIEQLTKL